MKKVLLFLSLILMFSLFSMSQEVLPTGTKLLSLPTFRYNPTDSSLWAWKTTSIGSYGWSHIISRYEINRILDSLSVLKVDKITNYGLVRTTLKDSITTARQFADTIRNEGTATVYDVSLKQNTLTNPVTSPNALVANYIIHSTGATTIGNTGSMIYDDGTNVGIGTTGSMAKFQVTDVNKAVALTYNVGIMTSDAMGINVGGKLSLGGRYSTTDTNNTPFGSIVGRKENVTNDDGRGYLAFQTTNATVYPYEYEWMRITSLGNVGIGTTSPTAYLNIKAGTATASQAPLKINVGVPLTVAEAGVINHVGNTTDSHFTVTPYVSSTATEKTLAYTTDIPDNTLNVHKAGTQTITGLKTFSQDITVNGVSIGIGNGSDLYSTRVGNGSLYNNTGTHNTVFGQAVLGNKYGGSNNAMFGEAVGNWITADAHTLTLVDNSTYFGTTIRAFKDSVTNEMIMGYDVTGHGSNTATWGNTSITDHYFNGIIHASGGVSGITSMTYPTADGIALKSGAGWGSSISNNSANWNTAYGWGDHAGVYLPLSGGTLTGGLNGTSGSFNGRIFSTGSNNYGNLISTSGSIQMAYFSDTGTSKVISYNHTGNTHMPMAFEASDFNFNAPATFASTVTAAGAITAPNFISNVATGTAPYATTSTTVNTNLNADMVDGLHVASGTYTPTFVDSVNINSVDSYKIFYIKIGNMVQIQINGYLTPTSGSTFSILAFTLPFASSQANGIGSGVYVYNSVTANGFVYSVSGTDAKFKFTTPASVGSGEFNIGFIYPL